MKYSITTGYWSGKGWRGEDGSEKAKFFEEIWWPNIIKGARDAKDVFVINSNAETLPTNKYGKWIDLTFNLGHVHDLDVNSYPNKKFGGWSMAYLMGAMLCYSNDTDFIFVEQDCIPVGNWIERMYSDLNNKNADILMGRQCDADGQALEQSLTIIRHRSILPFVGALINLNMNDAGPGYVRPEAKFRTILESDEFRNKTSYLSFGYGRSRPLSWAEETYYVQQLSDNDIKKLKFHNKI
jgi:hypothetical protein